MLVVPLQAVPSQVANVTLNGQACTIRAYQKFYGLFLDLLVDNNLIIGGVQCENNNRIVRSLYLGFQGDLAWTDTQGTNDPHYTGIGSRYFLMYITPQELPAGVG